MEFDGSSLWSRSANANGKERWSSAADPGGSHPRAMVLNKHPNKDADTIRKPDFPPSTPPPLAPSQGIGFGRGLSILTTAFRKSLSASSDATHGSGSSSNNTSQHTDNMNALHHYPSVASMGASVTSGTGSGTGSFYTAMSDTGNDSQSAGGKRNSGMGVLGPSITRKKKGSQTSLSTYPSIPSLPSTSRPSRSNPPVPLVPPLPPIIISKPKSQAPRTLDTISNLNMSPGASKSTSRAKAHLRTPAAHRVRADPHPQLPITRAGRSTHGVIDITEN